MASDSRRRQGHLTVPSGNGANGRNRTGDLAARGALHSQALVSVLGVSFVDHDRGFRRLLVNPAPEILQVVRKPRDRLETQRVATNKARSKGGILMLDPWTDQGYLRVAFCVKSGRALQEYGGSVCRSLFRTPRCGGFCAKPVLSGICGQASQRLSFEAILNYLKRPDLGLQCGSGNPEHGRCARRSGHPAPGSCQSLLDDFLLLSGGLFGKGSLSLFRRREFERNPARVQYELVRFAENDRSFDDVL